MTKIEMLDRDGVVVSRHDVHVCVGDRAECQDPAWCETCGKVASAETPIYVWTSETGVLYLLCRDDLSNLGPSESARVMEFRPLETGDVVAVLTHNGEVAYYGEITSVPVPGSDDALYDRGRYGVWNPETDEVHSLASADGEGFREATEAETDAYIERWADSEE